MEISARAYPHPVLSHFGDDIVDSVFQGVVEGKGSKNSYIFNATFKTNNDDLLELVQQKKAIYAVHVECNSTRYRTMFTSDQEKFTFEIPANVIDGKVQLCSLILAARGIPKYKNSHFHPDYGKLTFAVSKGDTLAVGHDRTFTADKKNDPLRRVASIFSIVQDDKPDAKALDIDPSNAKVVIKLSKENFDSYMILKHDAAYRPVLNSAIVLPALVDVIDRVRLAASGQALEAYSELRWFIVISRRLRDLGIDVYKSDSFVDSSVKIAHDLLGEPLTSALNGLKGISDNDE
jgi:hypothetical protein